MKNQSLKKRGSPEVRQKNKRQKGKKGKKKKKTKKNFDSIVMRISNLVKGT